MRLPHLCTLLLLFGVLLPRFSHAQGLAPDYATIMRGLEAHPDQVRSAFVRFTRIVGLSEGYAASIKAPSDYGRQTVTEQEWAFKGPKFYEKVTDTTNEAQQNEHQKTDAKNQRVATRIFDGELEHSFDSALKTAGGRYHYDAVGRPPHLNYESPLDCGYFVANKWIATALKSGHGTLVGTEQDPQFGKLSILTCQGDYNITYRFWIAPKFNYMSVRTEMASPIPDNPHAQTVAILRCQNAVKVDNIWLPGDCSLEASKRSNGSDTPNARIELKNISYQVNNVPDSLFDTTMPAGSVYYDSVAGTRYYIGAHGEKLLDEKFSTASHEFPFRLLFVGSLTIILALVMGGLAKWHRRSVSA